MQSAEEEQLQAVVEASNAQPPLAETDDVNRQLVPGTPSSGLLTVVEVCQFPPSYILFFPCYSPK